MANQCTWKEPEVRPKKQSLLDEVFSKYFSNSTPKPKSEEVQLKVDDYPGAMNAGWEHYFQWANKDHDAWRDAFLTAECVRLEESRRWLKYYEEVYEKDNAWWKKITMFALNGVQLFALWRQFRNQKEIAERTFELAERQQKIAEELFDFYNKVYYPHEVALGNQIDEYYKNPQCVDYDGIGDRFASGMEISFNRARRNLLRCNSSHCQPLTKSLNKLWAIAEKQAVGNARNGAYRYAELQKETKDNRWYEIRAAYIKIGRNISEQGQGGLMRAFNTFSAFGADPGAALSQLLNTVAHTFGGLINQPLMPNGRADVYQPPHHNYHAPYMTRVTQSGDLQLGKVRVAG